VKASDFHVLGDIYNFAKGAIFYPPELYTCRSRGAGSHDFTSCDGGGCRDSLHFRRFFNDFAPVLEPARVGGLDPNICVVVQDLGFQIDAEPPHDADHGTERKGTERHTENRQERDNGKESTFLGTNVTRRNKRYEFSPL